MIHERQRREGWGAAVIPRLSRDIRNELPEEKGFSERNIKRMLRFYREYPDTLLKVSQPVAQLQPAKNEELVKVPQPVAQMLPNELSTNLQQLVAKNPWGHNILLVEKVKNQSTRLWYMQQTIEISHQTEEGALVSFQAGIP
jgi:predicted nuclease of restriction endonuclease-like (RecB) superfamily